MTVDTPATVRRYAAARFVVRVGSEWSPMRIATIWPIADALATETGLEAAPPAATPGTTADRMVLDLIDSGMIPPPRPRRRRERPVSSRAVFYQAATA